MRVRVLVGIAAVRVLTGCGTGSATARAAAAALDSAGYHCAEGTVGAVFAGDSLTLTLPTGRTATLRRAVSASGIRYESAPAGLRLIGKGDDADVYEQDKPIYSHCIAGVVTRDTAAHTKTFVDGSRTFRITYPDSLDITAGEVGYSREWRANASALGMELAVVNVPRTFQPGTNFAGARFTIGVSSDSAAIANCTRATNGERSDGQTAIGKVRYSLFTLNDAAAGNLYRTTSARRLAGARCVAAEYTVHSSNIGNYDPSQHIREFDADAVNRMLDGMLRSFTLL